MSCDCACADKLAELTKKHEKAVGHFKTQLLKLSQDLAALQQKCDDCCAKAGCCDGCKCDKDGCCEKAEDCCPEGGECCEQKTDSVVVPKTRSTKRSKKRSKK